MDQLRRDLKAAFERQQSGLGGTREAPARLLTRALSTTGTRSRLLPRLAGYALTLVIAGAIAVTVLFSHGFLRQKAAPPANSIEQALTAGAPAAIGGGTGPAYVWFTGVIATQPPGSGSGQWAGENVEVLDWTGTVRYHFQVPHSTLPQGYNEIQAISADGTRALLDDGTVLDETGAVIGRIPALRSDGPAWQNQVRWMSDKSGVCAAFSNEPVAPPVAMPPKGQGTPPPQPIPPYAKPGADHSVTLKVFGLDGHVRTIATVGAGALGEPSGYMPDSTSVLACNPGTDLAVVARYHDADNNPADQSTTNMTVSLWAIKLSTGTTVFHQPETRMALGRAFFFGSENGKLAVEFLWNSKVWGSETDSVLQIPSGTPVPVLDAEPIPDTPAVSADGTRILRRLVDQTNNQTDLELIDASNGQIIRRVVIPSLVGASAVAQPGGSGFMVQVENYLALVDRDGGVSLLHPEIKLNQPGGVGLGGMPGLQG